MQVRHQLLILDIIEETLDAKLPEWDSLRTVLTEEQRVLCGYCRQVSDGYSYTEYEFYDPDKESISEVLICIKDKESGEINETK